MIVQLERIITSWMENETYGVNAHLALLDTDELLGSDDQPPDLEFIGCGADDEQVAQWEEPVNTPALYITVGQPLTLEGEVHTIKRVKGEAALDLLYIHEKADALILYRDLSHTLRAIVSSLADLNDNAQEDDRTLQGIFLKECTRFHVTPWEESIGKAKAVGLVQATFKIEDLNP